MLKIIKVVGDSMADAYCDGDFVLIIKSPFFNYLLKPNRDAVFYKKPYGIMIKRIVKVDKKKKSIDVRGLHEQSIDETFLKSIPYDDVIGVVLKRFK